MWGNFDPVAFKVILGSCDTLTKWCIFYTYKYYSAKLSIGVPCDSPHKINFLEFRNLTYEKDWKGQFHLVIDTYTIVYTGISKAITYVPALYHFTLVHSLERIVSSFKSSFHLPRLNSRYLLPGTPIKKSIRKYMYAYGGNTPLFITTPSKMRPGMSSTASNSEKSICWLRLGPTLMIEEKRWLRFINNLGTLPVLRVT